MTNPEKLAT